MKILNIDINRIILLLILITTTVLPKNVFLSQITGNNSYIERALSAGDVVWQRGLLTKGYSLCHGVAGNAYAFLDLYRVTHELKWFHRTIKVYVLFV